MQLMKKDQAKMKKLHLVFVDIEIAYNRVLGDIILQILNKVSDPRYYIQIIKGIYDRAVKTTCGGTCEFPVTIDLHRISF